MISEAIYWILSNNYAIPHIIHLLNNFLIILPPNVIPASQILAVKKFSLSLGSLCPGKNYAVTGMLRQTRAMDKILKTVEWLNLFL